VDSLRVAGQFFGIIYAGDEDVFEIDPLLMPGSGAIACFVMIRMARERPSFLSD
jgi:hypothetical protein